MLVLRLGWLSFLALARTVLGGKTPPTLDSVPRPTNLSLPLAQHHESVCFKNSQEHLGPTVGRNGSGISYGPSENISYAPKSHLPGAPIWRHPGIKLTNGSTCCQDLSQVREYIDYLDQTIFDLLSIRQQFVVEAGRFKESKQDVRATPRAVKVVQNAQTLAQHNGLAPWIANVTWTTALNSFTELELCLFDEDVRKKDYAPPVGH